MLRLASRAALAFGAYLGLLLFLLIGGFLGSAVGIWASVLWVILVAAVALYAYRRRRAGNGDLPPLYRPR